jgi:acetylornithine deacetylase
MSPTTAAPTAGPTSSARLADRLARLVAFDTQNPSGDERAMVEHLHRELVALGADAADVFTVGRHHGVLARFGARPRLLLNAHVDTVPANSGYSVPPHTLTARGSRLHGLGSADTKGAIAAILEALALTRPAPGQPAGREVAVLFSGDEEKGATVARSFLAGPRRPGMEALERVIVCEPTSCRVGSRHRGIWSAEAEARSPGGHSSRADDMPSPIATLARAAVALDQLGRQQRGEGPAGFKGLCLNLAAIDGGLAFNVVPALARLVVSVRPAPGSDPPAILAALEMAAREAAAPESLVWRVVHDNPPFATRDLEAFVPLLGERARRPVDLGFWTEAALFAAAGLDAVVFGPGDIAQAHGADEFVELAQLEEARDSFVGTLR